MKIIVVVFLFVLSGCHKVQSYTVAHRGGSVEVAYLIDNFEDADNPHLCDIDFEKTGHWHTFADDEQGASIEPPLNVDRSICSRGLVNGGAMGSCGSLHVSGKAAGYGAGVQVYLEWDSDAVKCRARDYSSNEGLVFWAKGQASVMVSLAMLDRIPNSRHYGGECDKSKIPDCYNFHHVELDINTDKWTEFVVPFKNVTQSNWGAPLIPFDPARVASVQFMFVAEQAVNPETGEFEAWIDEVGIYGGTPWPDLTSVEHLGNCRE